VAVVVVTPRAERDVEEAIAFLKLPADSWTRIVRSLQVLETFPAGGRALQGKWAGTRMVLGPWPWMMLLYRYDEVADEVRVVAMHDARSAASALSPQNS